LNFLGWKINWKVNDLNSGIYFVSIVSEYGILTKKVLVE